MTDRLNQQQQKQMERVLQGALEQSAKSLGMMLGGEVRINLSRFGPVPNEVCVWLGLEGALAGSVSLFLPEDMALAMVKRLSGGAELSLLDETARSMLMELGNVLASVFVAYYDQHRGLRTLPTPPGISLVPHPLPEGQNLFAAKLRWSGQETAADLLIGLDKSAVEILLG